MPLRKTKVDKQTGDCTSRNGEEETLIVSGVSRVHKGQVQLSLLRFDRSSRLQQFLLHNVHNTLEAYRIARRLGLPVDSINRKLPYLQSARTEQGFKRVALPTPLAAAIEAREMGPLPEEQRDKAPRPKPRFKTHPPGFIEVVAANIGLMWACATIKV